MRMYQVHVRSDDFESKGYDYYGSFREACAKRKEAKANGFTTDLRKIDVKFTKAGIIRAFNIYGGHADNG